MKAKKLVDSSMNKIVELSIKVTQVSMRLKWEQIKQKMGRSVQEVQIWVKAASEKEQKKKKEKK